MAANPPYYYLKKVFVSDIADFSSVPVERWRRIKFAVWKDSGLYLAGSLIKRDLSPTCDCWGHEKSNAPKLVALALHPRPNQFYNTNIPSFLKKLQHKENVLYSGFRALDSYSHCQPAWLIFQPAKCANTPLCERIVKQNKPKLDFSVNFWSRCTFFQPRCVPGTRPSDAPLQWMLDRAVYEIICCLLGT